MTEPRSGAGVDPGPPLAGLIVDWGGVLTGALQDCLSAFCEADGIDYGQFRDVMREWLGAAGEASAAGNPAHHLERGELPGPEFERALAARLTTRDGSPVQAEGLLQRMFAQFRNDEAGGGGMAGVVHRAHRAGIRTAVCSNSWANTYPREGWPELFDAVVISGEVGMRKPEPAIFRHTARLLSLPPQRCVFVDDLTANVRGAVAVGMVGVCHRTVGETVGELEALFGIPLGAAAA